MPEVYKPLPLLRGAQNISCKGSKRGTEYPPFLYPLRDPTGAPNAIRSKDSLSAEEMAKISALDRGGS